MPGAWRPGGCYLTLIESRTLPSTWRLLKRHGAVLYKGHNRVGLNTYPNIMALLTGEKTAKDPDLESLEKLISLVYREQGYVTLQMEDGVAMANFQAVWSPLIGRGPTLLRSHWSRSSLVVLAPAVLCRKEPAFRSPELGT